MKRLLPVGPRSVLWGAHCFFIHPWFVALAWWKLYGVPYDPCLWVAFFVHDLGYLFRWCEQMDDENGERHVEWGARLMTRLFDSGADKSTAPGERDNPTILIGSGADSFWCGPWGQFCLLHSRYYAKRHSLLFSRLCVADKLAITLEPWWLYLPRVILSGEIWEYLAYARGQVATAHGDKADSEYARRSATIRGWHRAMTDYCRAWVAEHRDGRQDTWTPEASS